MSGAGRRSHYRKHVTEAALHGTPEPQPGEFIARVAANRGGNLFDVELLEAATPLLTPSHAHAGAFPSRDLGSLAFSQEGVACFDCAPQRSVLAILPTKFHKLIWIKRGDFVIVASALDAPELPRTASLPEVRGDPPSPSPPEAVLTEMPAQAVPAMVPSVGEIVVDPIETGPDTGVSFMIQHVLYDPQVEHLKRVGLWPGHSVESKEANSEGGGLVTNSPELFENTNRDAMNRARLQYDAEDSSSDDEDDEEEESEDGEGDVTEQREE